MSSQIKFYDAENTLLVISSFPPVEKNKQRKNHFNAISWHSEKTLSHLSKRRKIIVCAERIGKQINSCSHKNLFVKRIWDKKKPFSLLSIIPLVLSLPRIQSVFVPFEFNVFGGIIQNMVLLVVLVCLRLLGKNVTVEIHQVVLDIGKLKKHIYIKNSLIRTYYNLGLRTYYLALGKVANTIIVFENDLKKRLLAYIPSNKIQVLSLAVEQKNSVNKNLAKRTVGLSKNIFTIMIFGFINGYKGIDWLIDTFSSYKKDDIRLIISGGKNPYLKDKLRYQEFYQSITNKIKKDRRIIYKGFIPDNQVKSYFSLADLLVLPYEIFMSASGPFSLALSYRKPVILSIALKNYMQSIDFKEAMKETGISTKDIFFPFKRKAFLRLLINFKKNRSALNKLTRFSSILGEKRNINIVIDQYEKIIFSNRPYFYGLYRKIAPAFRLLFVK